MYRLMHVYSLFDTRQVERTQVAQANQAAITSADPPQPVQLCHDEQIIMILLSAAKPAPAATVLLARLAHI